MFVAVKAFMFCVVWVQFWRCILSECPPDLFANCTEAAVNGDCVDEKTMEWMQCNCPTSCQTFSLCNETLGDRDCRCAKFASDNLCDTEAIQTDCPYTCALRTAEVTCDDLDLPPVWENTYIIPELLTYRYLDYVMYVCVSCMASAGGLRSKAKHICLANGTWMAHKDYTEPDCRVICKDDIEDCEESWQFCYYGSRLTAMWEGCAETCQVPAMCNDGEGEKTCLCGQHVKSGLCETNQTVHDSVCPVTCHRRDTITCIEPESYPHASPSGDRRYFATLNYTCDPGYVNEGGAGTRYCTLNGSWVVDAGKTGDTPNCQLSEPSFVSTIFTKMTFSEANVKMEYLYDVTAQSVLTCAQRCLYDIDCTHFLFKRTSTKCTLFNTNGFNVINVTSTVIWKKKY